MKSIHREVLQNNPKLLSPDRTISLGRLTALGMDALIKEEVERAVQILDRKSTAERAETFDKIGLPWKIPADKVDAVILLRNEILHENMDKPVTGTQIGDCRNITLEVPLRVCCAGLKRYPESFKKTKLLEMIDDIFTVREAVSQPYVNKSE
jgi:hypothetical protein